MDLQPLSGFERRGEYHRDEVIAAPCKLGTLDGFILDEFQRLAVRRNRLDLQKARQLKEQDAWPASLHHAIQNRIGRKTQRGFNRRVNLEGAHLEGISHP